MSYELSDKPELALDQFYRASLADPSNESLAIEVAARFSKKRQFEKATEVLKKSSQRPDASGKIFSALADACLDAGKTNSAEIAGRIAIKKSPDLISGYETLSEIYLKNGQTNAAVKILDSASRQTNCGPAFLVRLGQLYGTVLNTSSNIQQRGLSVLNRAADLKPKDPNLRRELADEFAHFGDLEKTSKLYLELLNEFSDVPLMRDALRERLTNLYLQGHDKTKAAEQLESIVRDNPTRYPEAWLYLGNFAYDDRNYAKAAEDFQRALLINPDLEQAYYDLSAVQMNLDQPGEALKTLETARKKFPTSFTAEFFTAMAFAHLADYQEALHHYTAAEVIAKATDATRLNHLFYFQLGSTYERVGDIAESEKYLQKSLQLAPNFSDALNYLGFMWADRGIHLDQARQMIEKAVKLEPKNSAYLDSLGWVFYKLNDYESAMKYLLQAIESSDEPEPEIYDHLGDVYSALKQDDRARAAWKKSISMKPNDAVAKKLKRDSQ
jgi:tetratricopeptide (TPR) repeat protein